MMTQPVSPVPEGAAEPAEGGAEDMPQTFNAPVAALGDVQEGSTLTVKVISVDEQAGTATLSLAQAEPEADIGGTEGMADEFQSPERVAQ